MASLVPQFTPAEEKGTGRVRADSLRSGRLTGRYQLTGSLLVLKDTSNSVSGFLSFSTSISAAPTSSSTGTGVYIDYTGIYGLNGGTKQFYLLASDGKAYAGAGTVIIDTDGITITAGQANANSIKWMAGTENPGLIWADYGAVTHASTLNMSSFGEANVGYSNVNIDATGLSGYNFNRMNLKSFATTYGTVGLRGVQWARFYGNDLTKYYFMIGGSGSDTPAALLHLNSTAPTVLIEDSTASAKSLLVTVNANKATIEELAGSDLLTLDLANLSVVVGNAALATTATDGFLYIPACAGVPTGAPTAYTGRAPMVIDSTNNKMYIYSGGAWVALN